MPKTAVTEMAVKAFDNALAQSRANGKWPYNFLARLFRAPDSLNMEQLLATYPETLLEEQVTEAVESNLDKLRRRTVLLAFRDIGSLRATADALQRTERTVDNNIEVACQMLTASGLHEILPDEVVSLIEEAVEPEQPEQKPTARIKREEGPWPYNLLSELYQCSLRQAQQKFRNRTPEQLIEALEYLFSTMLTAKKQEILRICYIEGLSCGAASKRLGLTRQAAYLRRESALQSLRDNSRTEMFLQMGPDEAGLMEMEAAISAEYLPTEHVPEGERRKANKYVAPWPYNFLLDVFQCDMAELRLRHLQCPPSQIESTVLALMDTILSPPVYQAVNLYYKEEESGRTVAETLDIPRSTVNNRLSAALSEFRVSRLARCWFTLGVQQAVQLGAVTSRVGGPAGLYSVALSELPIPKNIKATLKKLGVFRVKDLLTFLAGGWPKRPRYLAIGYSELRYLYVMLLECGVVDDISSKGGEVIAPDKAPDMETRYALWDKSHASAKAEAEKATQASARMQNVLQIQVSDLSLSEKVRRKLGLNGVQTVGDVVRLLRGEWMNGTLPRGIGETAVREMYRVMQSDGYVSALEDLGVFIPQPENTMRILNRNKAAARVPAAKSALSAGNP